MVLVLNKESENMQPSTHTKTSQNKNSGGTRRIAKNALFLYGLTFSNYFVGLLLFPYLSRVLSVEGFGVVGFSTSFCLIFQMIVEYGFQICTTATVSVHRDDKDKVSRIISTMTYSKALLAVIALLGFGICIVVMPSVQANFVVVAFFLFDAIIKAFMPDAYFRGIERMRDITIRSIAAKSGILIVTLIFVKSDADLLIYPISMTVCDGLALGWAFLLIHQDGIRFTASSIKEILLAIKESFWFFISRISVSINGSLGSLFLGTKYSPSSVEMGLYSGATRLSTAGEQMIPPVGDALYPAIMRHKDYRTFRRILMIGGMTWAVVCTFVALLATPLCVIVLGTPYAAAGPYLRILMIGVFIGFFSYMFGYPALSPIGKATWANAAIMVAAAINLVLCAMLWLTNNVTPLSICIVFGCTNVWTFLFRFGAYLKFRKLTAD